jgi:hypothetical protein
VESAPSSTDSATAPDLLGDGGPAFTPGAGDTPPPAVDVAGALEGSSKWFESRVRSLLTAKGSAVHALLAVDKGRSSEWLYTEADLSAIAPALTRILNRYPGTRAAAAMGDEATVAIGFAGYAARSWSERRMLLAIAALEQADAAGVYVEPDAPTPAAAAMATAADVAGGEPVEFPDLSDTPPISARGRR